MAYKIEAIEGIGDATTLKLEKAGIKTTGDLLKHCCDKKGRKSIAEMTGCSEKKILNWTNMADLMRISGVGEEFSELLKMSGVDTVKELRNRNAENLAAAMKATNEEKKLTRTVPSGKTVQKWIDHAKTLDPIITH
jgi:nucleotidyltransferase/DNA polymerase involved in DNA repair